MVQRRVGGAVRSARCAARRCAAAVRQAGGAGGEVQAVRSSGAVRAAYCIARARAAWRGARNIARSI